MNRDDIIRMAREAGDYLVDKRGREDFIFDCYGIERFAALVANHVLVQPCCGNFKKCQRLCMPRAAAAEREACAKVCQELDAKHRPDYCTGLYYATAIRARGQG